MNGTLWMERVKVHPISLGSAASISKMIIEGLFGIDWDYRNISIRPHFELDNGYIYIPQVASGKFLSYTFKVLSTTAKKVIINLSFGSNTNHQKTLSYFQSHTKDIAITTSKSTEKYLKGD